MTDLNTMNLTIVLLMTDNVPRSKRLQVLEAVEFTLASTFPRQLLRADANAH